jgi:hypothetical protein
MTVHTLRPHPTTPCPFIDSMTAFVEPMSQGVFRLAYEVRGDIARLDIPAAQQPLRTDDLWRRTCFEVFVRSPHAAAYDEFNFSPSSEWAAWRFEHYRTGRVELELAAAPEVICTRDDRHLLLSVVVGRGDRSVDEVQIGLSAVLRDREGQLCYWALRHAPGKPDFHHDDAFAARLMLS